MAGRLKDPDTLERGRRLGATMQGLSCKAAFVCVLCLFRVNSTTLVGTVPPVPSRRRLRATVYYRKLWLTGAMKHSII